MNDDQLRKAREAEVKWLRERRRALAGLIDDLTRRAEEAEAKYTKLKKAVEGIIETITEAGQP